MLSPSKTSVESNPSCSGVSAAGQCWAPRWLADDPRTTVVVSPRGHPRLMTMCRGVVSDASVALGLELVMEQH